jgi:hypothetical protein
VRKAGKGEKKKEEGKIGELVTGGRREGRATEEGN